MMDTPEKYIKMCEKAFSLLGDVISPWLTDGYRYNFYSTINDFNKKYPIIQSKERPVGWFQVYFQDQLQEMTEENIYDYRYYQWLRNNAFYQDVIWESREQLRLAFVMHEKYRKTWDDEKKEWKRE